MNPDIASRIPPSMRDGIATRMARLRAERDALNIIVGAIRQLRPELQEEIADRILEGLPEGAE
jgi:hypothetical protein